MEEHTTQEPQKEFTLHISQEQLDSDAAYYDPHRKSTLPPPTPPTMPEELALTFSIEEQEKQEKREQKEHRRRNRIKARKNKHIFTAMWVLMVVLVALSIGNYLVLGANDFLGKNRRSGYTKVEIPNHVSIDQMADILFDNGVISRRDFFTLYCNLTTDVSLFRAGTFEVDTTLDYEGIINFLQTEAEMESTKLTIREGINLLELAELLEENKVCSVEEFLEWVNSDEFTNYWIVSAASGAKDTYYKLEGYLFPDKYDFYLGESPKSVIGKMLNNFQNRLSEELQEKINQSGMSMHEVVTLASLIQAEAANAEDMYMISAILHNRLDYGVSHGVPTLGLDSTKYYPYRTAEKVPPELVGFASTYDTYDSPGLPAGPICNPGLEAIKAALSPSEEGAGYYYFGHDANGKPYYARTYEEHLYNQSLWE